MKNKTIRLLLICLPVVISMHLPVSIMAQNVGIGTPTPDSLLTVKGGGLYANRGVRFSGLPSSTTSPTDLMVVQDSVTGVLGHRAVPAGGVGRFGVVGEDETATQNRIFDFRNYRFSWKGSYLDSLVIDTSNLLMYNKTPYYTAPGRSGFKMKWDYATGANFQKFESAQWTSYIHEGYNFPDSNSSPPLASHGGSSWIQRTNGVDTVLFVQGLHHAYNDVHYFLADMSNTNGTGIPPNRLLTVEHYGNAFASFYNNPANDNPQILFGKYPTWAQTNYQNYRFVNGGTLMQVDTAYFMNNVGIGTATPIVKLHIKGSADASQFIIDANSTQSNSNPLIKLRKSDGTDLMWIHSDDTSNIFIGLNAGRVNNAAGGGIYNTFIGNRAGYSNTTGTQNIANGNYALRDNTTGSYNTATGYGALLNNSTGSYNTASGYGALSYNVAGSFATAFGQGAMFYANNTTTPFTNVNVAVGFDALRGSLTPANNTGNYNTALGYQALRTNSSGDNNTASGFQSLYFNTTGAGNSVTGVDALYSNITGQQNTASGMNALYSNVAGSNGTAIGFNAMRYANNTTTPFNNFNVAVGFEALRGSAVAADNTGDNNTATGYQSLWANTIGSNNTANGKFALYSNTEGANNTAIGYATLNYNTTGTYNTAIGGAALTVNTTGNANTATGMAALNFNTTGFGNTANGQYALSTNVAGSGATAIGYNAMRYAYNSATPFINDNVAVGYEALRGSTNPAINMGFQNTAIGYQSLFSTTGGNTNTANGAMSLYSNTTGQKNSAYGSFALFSNTSGNLNTANGLSALYYNTTGINNTAIGVDALSSNVSGNNATAIGFGAMLYANNTATPFTNFNVAVGFEALRGSAIAANNTGNYNTVIGYRSLWSNTTGDENTANGVGALYLNTIGNFNVANGVNALVNNSSGSYNTANGNEALFSNNTGSQNTAIGYRSLSFNTSGNNNTANGYRALTNNLTGSWNTCLGENANVSNSFLDGATAIGTGAITNASNKIVIGAALPGIMVIGGYAPWSDFSDGRFKTNIIDDVPGLSFITQLKPITYNIDTKKLDLFLTQNMPDSIAKQYIKANETYAKNLQFRYTGFIAQDVEKLANDLGWKFDGVNIPKNPGDNYSIAYSQFVMPLVKAVQEQQQMITKQNNTINDQANTIQDLIKRITVLESKLK